MPISVAEMTDVSRLLMAAIGNDNKEDDEESDDNQNSDSSDEENNYVTLATIEHTNTNMDFTDTSTATFDSKNTSAPLSVNDDSTNLRCRNSKIKRSLVIIFLNFIFIMVK